jgi:hypothetical protein
MNLAAQSSRLSFQQLLEHFQHAHAYTAQQTVAAIGESVTSNKCGFSITAQMLAQWKQLTDVQRKQYQEAVKSVTTQCDTVIGHFHIYYDTTGDNTPALIDVNNNRIAGTTKAFVDSVGSIFNHVWDVEINELGFAAPPFESGQTAYNIYIQERSRYNEYGETDFLDQLPNDSLQYYTETFIDNDFANAIYSTKGIAALQVTAAHEFHHAIQIGSYGYWGDDERYAYEMTSVWMESYVYPTVHDYYQYLPDYFLQFNGLSLYSVGDGGYERVVWAQFLAKRFGAGMMKDIWNHMATERYVESVRDAIAQHGSTLSDEFAQFAYCNYFTADRADTVKSYFNGYAYPRFTSAQTVTYSDPQRIIPAAAEPLSMAMYNFVDAGDTVTSIMINTDISAALQRSTAAQSVKITLSSSSLYTPYQILSNGLYAGYSADHTDVWRTFYLQSTTHSDIPSTNFAALPNPLNMEESNRLVLPVPNEADAVATVSFVSSSLNSVFNRQFNTSMEFGKRSIAVPTSLLKSKLSSGIYFVIATVNGNQYKWKVAVIK